MNGWSGNIIEPGPYVSDGYILLREDYTDRHLMRYLRRLHPKGSPACASQTQAAALWKITGRRAVVPLEWIGQIALTRGSCGRATRPLILDRFKRDAARRPMPTVEIDSEKLDLLWRATFFEELQCSTKKRHVVARVVGEMVGVIMPMWGGLPWATA